MEIGGATFWLSESSVDPLMQQQPSKNLALPVVVTLKLNSFDGNELSVA